MRIGLKTSIACAATVLVFSVLALLHVRPVNGPSYFVWAWRTLPWDCWLLTIAGALPLLATIVWMWRRPATTRSAVVAQLAALMLASALLKAAVLIGQASPINTTYAVDAIRSPWATSYFYDAARLRKYGPGWVAQYDELVGSLSMHTRTKPIGPTLYFYWITGALGYSPVAALTCAAGLIALASAAIPATYACVKTVVAGEQSAAAVDDASDEPPDVVGRRAGLVAAAIIAVAPGFVLFPAKFDAIWIAFAAMMTLAWYRAIRTDRVWPWSIVLGATLALLLFCGFHQLTLGILMVAMPLILRPGRVAADHIVFFVRHGLAVAGVAVAVHVLVEAISGYNTLATFFANVETQRLILSGVPGRRAPYTTHWDLYDFALGFGWCGAIVFVAALVDRRVAPRVRLIGAAAVAQLMLIAVAALIPAETSRCWLFLSIGPLIVVGASLARWSAGARATVATAILGATLVLNGTMRFNEPWPNWPARMPAELMPQIWRELPQPTKNGEPVPQNRMPNTGIDAPSGNP